ncbi:MAG: geranylgeranyl reductase [Candidatus Eremiobacteraeota bacterium]|nr:geranylgeranyl reductase [Candidatus Eremiobacteraeota bacterium]
MKPDAVVVSGAGPAGSVTALLLARAGVDVRIVERARFPRTKVCGEYLNAGAVEALARLGALDDVRTVASGLRGVRLVPAGAAAVALAFPRPALACARAELDAVLLAAAVAAGAILEQGRVEDVLVEHGRCTGVRVRTPAGDLEDRPARIVVGADGIGSVVARKLGVTAPAARGAHYAVGGHYAGFEAFDGFVEMYVGGGAYFALNPLRDGRTNVMVVVPRARLARWSADVDAGIGGAAAALAGGARSFGDAVRIGPRVSIGPLAHRVRRPWAPGAVLVGDAAGFLDPFTGQGVFLALTGAERAADAIRAALRDPAREASAFAEYGRWRDADVAWRRRLARAVALLVDVPPLARRAANRLARFPDAGTALLDALAGIVPPERAFRPSVLGRLLA